MHLSLKKPSVLVPYVIFLLSFLFLFFLNFFRTTSFTVSLSFLLIVFLPGFSLVRIFKITYESVFDGLIYYLTLGFVFNLFLCLVGILFGLNIIGLSYLIVFALIGIFLAGLGSDLLEPDKKLCQKIFNFKDIFKLDNLIYLFLLLLIVLVLSTVDQLGTNFTGDPLDHLSAMRKAIEGKSLTVENLSHAKGEYHIAYGIPVWHVFLTFLSKINHLNIFTFYREITTVLSGLAFFVWYYLLRKILPTRQVAILALFLFILFHFYNNGYLYTRLPVPDTLNMLLLMPLCFALALNYIFSRESNYKHLIVLSLMAAFMGVIHWTQYFYYLFAMGLFAIIYLIFKFKDEDFKSVFLKIIWAVFANMIIVLPLIGYLQLKGGTIARHFSIFPTVAKGSNNDRLYKFDPYFKLSYIFLPLILVFVRRYRRLIFILGIFLVGPLVYNLPGVYSLCRRVLSHVFVNRLYSNLGQWPYIIWAILLGFILVLIDRAICKINPSRKYLRYSIDAFAGISFFYLVWLQFKTGKVNDWYNAIFSNNVFNYLNANYNWLIPVVFLIGLAIFFIQKYRPKLTEFFAFSEYKNSFALLFLSLAVVFFLGMPSFSHLSYYPKKEFQNWHFFTRTTDPSADFINPDKFGGMAAIDFIKANVPAKSVFDTNTFANYTLPTLTDVHMASWTFDPEPTKKYKDLYENIPIEKKLALLEEGEIDYLIYQYQAGENQSPFDFYPEYFVKIYDSNAPIYKVNKEQVKADLRS